MFDEGDLVDGTSVITYSIKHKDARVNQNVIRGAFKPGCLIHFGAIPVRVMQSDVYMKRKMNTSILISSGKTKH